MGLPLHIDVDTGTDDAIALLCAFLSERLLDIYSISTVAGNVPLELTSKNTLNLVDAVKQKINVAKGAKKPLKRNLECAISHGVTGIGDVVLPESKRSFYEKNAWETIYESACKADGNLVYLGVGPQTNLAIALEKFPDLKNKIKKIYFMGGSLIGGNMTQASEFNAYVDPEALKTVIDSGIPIFMVGLDVTLKTVLPSWVVNKLKNMENTYAKIATDIMEFSLRFNKELGYDEMNIHDAVALCAIVKPNIFQTKNYYMDIETEGKLTRGMTVADIRAVYPDRKPNVECAVDIVEIEFWNWMVDLFQSAEKNL